MTMDQFPSEFSELLSPKGLEVLQGENVSLPVNLTCEGEHFFAMPDLLDPDRALDCLRILERDFGGRLGAIRARIPPESITSMTRNFSETLPRTAHVESVVFGNLKSELHGVAEQDGLLTMLRSNTMLRFAEGLTGLRLEGGWGSQMICYKHRDYLGPHNDHRPEFDWARRGYIDVLLTFANDAVEHQWFVHEKDGLLSQVWSMNLPSGVTVSRQPFWHYTTPLMGKRGLEAAARRWLVGQVFRILDNSQPTSLRSGSGVASSHDGSTRQV
jgi:hypothetical protein